MKTRLHFSRYELKYLLRKAQRDEIESELQVFLDLDPYVAKRPEKKYLVRSLYYDNKAMVCYYEKIDGMMDRSKFRVRTYTDSPDGTAKFLEVKGRHNALVFKHRSELAPNASDGASVEDSSFDATTRQVLSQLESGSLRSRFLRDLYRKELEPVILVDYLRRPYFSKVDPEFRLTFDDSLACTVTPRLFPRRFESNRRILPGFTILEVKFKTFVPQWFHRVIQSFELRRVSISKYCAGVETCHLAAKLE